MIVLMTVFVFARFIIYLWFCKLFGISICLLDCFFVNLFVSFLFLNIHILIWIGGNFS